MITCTLFPGAVTDRTQGTLGRDIFAPSTGQIIVSRAVGAHALAMAAGLGWPSDPTDEEASRLMWSELLRLSVAADEFDPRVVPVGDHGLRWEGAFTPGRWVEVTLNGRAVLSWDTGTGRPSWWVGRMLSQMGLARVPRAEVQRAARAGLSPEEHGRLTALAV